MPVPLFFRRQKTILCYCQNVSAKTFATRKQAEARARMTSLRRARKSRKAAVLEQRRVSFVSGGSKWRMTNLANVLRAMS